MVELENKNYVRGMLVGGALGDALGAPHEFDRKKTYTGELIYPLTTGYGGVKYGRSLNVGAVGQVTDDTEMTLIVLNSIIDSDGIYNQDHTIHMYLDWANHPTSTCMGKNTRKMFKGVKTVKGYKQRIKDPDTQSNGALMRCAPFGLYDKIPGEQYAMLDCELTNNNIVCKDVNRAYLKLIRLIRRNRNRIKEGLCSRKDLILTVALRIDSHYVKNIIYNIIALENIYEDKRISFDRDITQQKGWCLHAWYCTVWYFLYGTDWKSSIDDLIKRGGDTDTNAAIVGSLLGYYYGLDSMLKENITACNYNTMIVNNFEQKDLERPPLYKTNNIIKLADKYTIIMQEYRKFTSENKSAISGNKNNIHNVATVSSDNVKLFSPPKFSRCATYVDVQKDLEEYLEED
jgi:ADP-ribosylglycohydrolase